MKKFLLVAIILLKFSFIQAQERTISGKIISSDDQLPLPGVSVSVKDGTGGTTSDADGNYVITIAPETKILLFQFAGFRSQELPVGVSNTIDVTMETDAKVMEEVVVVGYGIQERRDITGSISKVNAKDIANLPVTSIEQSIQGRTPGVFIESPSGKLAGSMKVRIRGASSVSASNQPLFVVDGFPITTKSQTDSQNNEDTNPLADIDPNDIASVEVLKDASAGAIYGSRAANGVVLITTKRGKQGKTLINGNVSLGVSTPTHLTKFLDAKGYDKIFRESAENLGYTGAITDDAVANQAWDEAFGIGKYTDLVSTQNNNWSKLGYRNARFQNYSVSAAGGSEKTKFYVSGGYTNQEGIILSNRFQRMNGRLNLDHQATKKLNLGGSVNLIYSINNLANENNSFTSVTQANALAPILPLRDDQGEYNFNTFYDNPLLQIKYQTSVANTLRSFSNVYGNYKILPFLNFRSEFGLDFLDMTQDYYAGKKSPDGFPNGQGNFLTSRVINYTTNNYLTFSKIIDEHALEIVGGISFQQSNTTSSQIQGRGFPDDKLPTLSSASTIITGISKRTMFNYLSYYARANYKFKNKYLLSISARSDGSSRFGSNHRFGFFPAASAGWVLTEEDFIKDVTPFSFLKLRASYGITGNSEIDDFAARGLYTPSFYGASAGIIPHTFANPNLKWETTRQSDLGVDFGFFKDRIWGTFDVYWKYTTDLLLNTPAPLTSGYDVFLKNAGSLNNKGWELSVTTLNLTGNFKWSTSLNISRFTNRITNLANLPILPSGNRDINAAIEGQPIGVFYGVKYAGVDPANGDALYYTKEGRTTNDYSQGFRQVLGSPLPKHFGGLTNTVSFAGFDLTIFMQYVFGNKIYNAAGIFQQANFSGGYLDNQTVDQLNYWTPQNTKTNIPKPILYGGDATGEKASSRWLYDGSYLRFKTVTLGYSIPKALLGKAKISSLRLYVTAQNLFTVTKYPMNDPEVNYTDPGSTNQAVNLRTGYDWYSAPQVRTIIGGLNIGL
jgi:TonB-linked SusC/RagA family outer membrane protein